MMTKKFYTVKEIKDRLNKMNDDDKIYVDGGIYIKLDEINKYMINK